KVETNPSPVKTAMNMAGMEAGPVRLPLMETGEEGKALLKNCLKDAGII
ncbi:unnamed protein product, partial [marine sediment metagenome]